DLLAECRQVREDAFPGGLPVGQAVTTGAGGLPARWVIHTVGPNRHRGQTAPDLMAACFTNCLHQAVAVGAGSVAFPAIDSGVNGRDADEVGSIGGGKVSESRSTTDG